MIDLMQLAAQIGGIGGLIAVLVFLMYRRDRKDTEKRIHDVHEAHSERLERLMERGQEDMRERTKVDREHTKALTELTTYLKLKNGSK